ncbi:MAG TPA: HAD family phosphatase [Syntrophorhabdaceae bacterium]|nr:HAD family phosphatase [Syntrophorhabdaceae bacterium]HRV23371.1 HAD family phosphatase [Syntrophorhabdaceae bacterium]
MIRLFVFDLGNVILPFDHRQIPAKLLNWSTKKGLFTPEEMFIYLFDWEDGLINPYEEGYMSSEEFFDTIRQRYSLNMNFEDFKNIWTPIFKEDQEVNKIILNLKQMGYPLFILSNTNELHFTYIKETYPIVHTFHEWILSYEVHAKKPKKRIFDEIFNRMDVPRDEVFYIDDTGPYIEQAKAYGLKGTVFTDAENLWRQIKDIIEYKREPGNIMQLLKSIKDF